MENLDAKNQIRTFTGKYIDIINPTVDQIDIRDIAHGLSMQCRFAGQIPEFYSVAQHSMYVATKARFNDRKENELMLLLHDASEAYIGDIAKPIKENLPDYIRIEENLMAKIGEKFGFEWPPDTKEKERLDNIDYEELQNEWRYFMFDDYSIDRKPMSSSQAYMKFMEMYYTIAKY